MKTSRGFTLIEITVVLTVITILAALLLPVFVGILERTRMGRARSDVSELGEVIKRVSVDTANTTSACLTDFGNFTLISAPAACTPPNAPHGVLPLCSEVQPGYMCWSGPYLTRVGNDPWSDSYIGTQNPITGLVVVQSYGPDTLPDTDDDITQLR